MELPTVPQHVVVSALAVVDYARAVRQDSMVCFFFNPVHSSCGGASDFHCGLRILWVSGAEIPKSLTVSG